MQRKTCTVRRPTVSRRLLAAFLVLGVIVASGQAVGVSAAAEFIPHRAYYKMSLLWAKAGTGIANIDGDLAADWDQSCAGWTLTQKSVLNIYSPDGRKRVSLKSTISTWESADGGEYRFQVSNATNNRKTDVVEGVARVPRDKSKKGWADFNQPKKKRVELPAGTMFPTMHTIYVLKRLHKAPTIVSKDVFDGLTEQGLHQINAVVGPRTKKRSTMDGLTGRSSWPVQLAFFKPQSTASEPDYEIGMHLYDNGVGDNLVIDYGNFKVRATLERLEMGQRATCN